MKHYLRKTLAGLLLAMFPGLWAQPGSGYVEGVVSEENDHGHTHAVIGANVYWSGTTTGTITDENGHFRLARIENTHLLVISYVGYLADTLDAKGLSTFDIRLSQSRAIDEVEIAHRQKSTGISRLDPIKTYNVGEKELLKAACCNLSESFETNPSVDVSFTDAVTGTRQIQMLGLAGPYTQITRENMPDVRGLSAIYGLGYIPGTWIESIQLIKGTGSVVNGFESVAGQINTELRKPESAERMYLNLYANEGGRVEANANFAHRFRNNRWSTGMLLHGKDNSVEWDRNGDGFLDHPLGKQFIGLNRWKYIGEQGLRMQFGVKGTYLDNTGGQAGFSADGVSPGAELWGMTMNTQRIEGWAKFGKVYEDMPWKSVALQLSGMSHRHRSDFGLRRYDADQESVYANLVYQSILTNTNHKFKTGASFQYDKTSEYLSDTGYAHTEAVPGLYFEYTFTHFEKFTAVAGFRADYHSLYGPFLTPRVHIRYAPTEKTVLRASAGRGQRTANIIAENIGLLASSRQIIIEGIRERTPYGLDPEIAWNWGVNITHHFRLNYREGVIGIDFYHTDFTNQIVVDIDQSSQQAIFYNLKGRSFSNSLNLQLDYELIRKLDVRLAYRFYDVQTTYTNNLMDKPLQAAHRAFTNLAYATRNNWKFDYTVNWQGRKRLPNTAANPPEYRLTEYSPSFFVMNAQLSKSWKDKFEVYAGVENLLNYKQKNPIVSSADPFGPYFDSSMIWGPVFGRNFYLGLRFRLE